MGIPEVQEQYIFRLWLASLDQHQSRTDILDVLDAGRQELALLPPKATAGLLS